MADTSALLVVELILMLFAIGYVLNSYKAPAVEHSVVASTYIAWTLGFAGIVLLPYDIAIALVENVELGSLRSLWDTIYWSTFVLAWVTLPVQLPYHMSGHFTVTGKLYESLWSNAISYAIGFIMFVIFVIYMLSTNGGSTAALMGFMMAMANTYGLIIVIVLMGNGLIALPRRIWEMGNTSQELVRLYMLASSVDSAFHDARFDLEDCEIEAERLKSLIYASGVDLELQGYYCRIEEAIKNFEFQAKSVSRKYSQRPKITKESESEEDLEKAVVKLHGQLLSSQRRILSCWNRWLHLLETVKFLEDVTGGTLAPEDSSWCQMRTKTLADSERVSRYCNGCVPVQRLYDSARLKWRLNIYPFFCKFCAIIAAVGSGMILWSEMTMAFSSMDSPVGTFLNHLADNGAGVFMVQFFSFLALSYMSICTYWAMFRINLGWAFTLQPNQQSPSTSLLFNATYFCRLQFSLAFNFLLLLNNDGRMSTSFEGLFVSMELVPLFGAEFTVYAPIIVLIVGFLTLLNVYARILKVIGIESEDAVTGSCTTCHKLDADDIELIAVGKKLVTSQMHFVSGQARGSKSSTSVATSKQKIVKMSEFSEYTGDIENPLTIRNDGRVVGTSGADKTEVAGVVYSSVESVNEGLSKYEQDSRFGTDSDWGSTSSWSGQSGIDAGGWGKPSHVLLPMQGTGGRSAASLKASRNTASNVTAPERLASYAPTQALHKQADFSSNDSSGSSTIKSYGGRYKR